MSSQQTGISIVKKAYNTAVKSLKAHPRLFLPFIIFAIVEFLALILIFLIPRMPLRLALGPPIRTFWGEIFLHYPANFLLLPKLANLARMGLSVVLGSLLTAVAVAVVFDLYQKKQVKLETSFQSALKKYLSLFMLVFILTALFYLLIKIISVSLAKYFIAGHSKLLFIKAEAWMGLILTAINFLLALFIQSAFIYAIPLLMIEKEKLFKAIFKSFILFKQLFIPTIILVGLPMLLYIPIIVLNNNTAFLIDKFFPEIILLFAVLSIIVSSLVIDPLVTVSVTFLYLIQKEK